MRRLHVVAAAILRDGRYLCALKGRTRYGYTSFKYEFPGGKVEPGETPRAALERELREELGCEASAGRLLGTVSCEYPDFAITLDLFLCRIHGTPVFREHAGHVWLPPGSLRGLDWAAADTEALALIPGVPPQPQA